MKKWELVFEYYDFKHWFVHKKLNALVDRESKIEKIKETKKVFLDTILSEEIINSNSVPRVSNNCHSIDSKDDDPIFKALKKINKEVYKRMIQWSESEDYQFYQHSIQVSGGRYISIINTKKRKIYFLIPDINHHIFFDEKRNTHGSREWDHNTFLSEYIENL